MSVEQIEIENSRRGESERPEERASESCLPSEEIICGMESSVILDGSVISEGGVREGGRCGVK